MNTEIIFIILFGLGFYLGYKLASAIHVKMIKLMFTELGITEQDLRKVAQRAGVDLPEEPTAESDLDEYEIRVEKHGDELYAFKIDGEFLGQGRDRDSLVARIAERYTNVRFTVAEGKEYLSKD